MTGFWSGYWKSLKPLSVEEPIDVWVHRPIAYLLARSCLPTPVSPNLVTLGSICLGLAAGCCFVSDFPAHLRAAGLFVFLSAVFDCADGQLARMRGTSSRFGRMLDGTADLVVIATCIAGVGWVLWHGHHRPAWVGCAVLAAVVLTAVTGSFHTTMYDHYKNVFLRMTLPAYHDAEDFEAALARYAEEQASDAGICARIAWPIYLFYVKSQEDYVRGFDPSTAPRLSDLPPYDAARAQIYREHAEPVMRVWRRFFGFGSLVFGVAVASTFDILGWYVALRLVVQNAAFYGYLRPAQRRASQDAFREMNLSFDGGAEMPVAAE